MKSAACVFVAALSIYSSVMAETCKCVRYPSRYPLFDPFASKISLPREPWAWTWYLILYSGLTSLAGHQKMTGRVWITPSLVDLSEPFLQHLSVTVHIQIIVVLLAIESSGNGLVQHFMQQIPLALVLHSGPEIAVLLSMKTVQVLRVIRLLVVEDVPLESTQ